MDADVMKHTKRDRLEVMAVDLCPFKDGHPPHGKEACGACKNILNTLRRVERSAVTRSNRYWKRLGGER